MKIKAKADDILTAIEDLQKILDAADDDTVMLEAFTTADGSEDGRVVVRADGRNGNFASFNVIRAKALEPGFATFHFREIAKVAFAFERSTIIVSVASDNSSTASIQCCDETVMLETSSYNLIVAPNKPAGERAVLETGALLSCLDDVQHAQSDDYELRRSLCGVQFEIAADMKLRAIATNGRCLAVSERRIMKTELEKPTFSAYLSTSACEFLSRVYHGEMTTIIKYTEKMSVYIETDGGFGHFASPGAFPDWRQCLPKDPKPLATLHTSEMLASLMRAVTALGKTETEKNDDGDDESYETSLKAHLFHVAGNDHMELTVTEAQGGETPLFFKYIKIKEPYSTDFNAFFDARYLVRMLRAMIGDVEISADKLSNKQLGPFVFKCMTISPELYEVIMPMRAP